MKDIKTSELKPCPFCSGETEALLMMFVKDSYSTATGKPTKKTGLALMRYIGKDKELQRLVNIGDWNSVLKYQSDCNSRKDGETPSEQLAAAKAQYDELSSFVQSLQLDSVSDDAALDDLLAKHKESK